MREDVTVIRLENAVWKIDDTVGVRPAVPVVEVVHVQEIVHVHREAILVHAVIRLHILVQEHVHFREVNLVHVLKKVAEVALIIDDAVHLVSSASKRKQAKFWLGFSPSRTEMSIPYGV
ncbi:hypothetical protein T4D_13762 [Trichinella pseudospiralis]|uniref:Uncharacterized protein n=1 Tax=Trichinella pseudospiralis TaxID=6337 RepID=A0A0V1G0J7_TRIPS|nr:hypothetical protein T4D_13762 [Trichinella pseudospiralis]